MSLESHWMFACLTGLVVAAGTACGSPPPEEVPPELVEEEESETPDGTETHADVTSETPEPIEVGCDPRAPGVPCCTTTFSEELETDHSDPYVPWEVRRDGAVLDLEPMTATTFVGHWAGLEELDEPAALSCPLGARSAGLDCEPTRAAVVELPGGDTVRLVVPIDLDEIALSQGDEIEIDFAEGLRIWNARRDIVLHLYRPPVEPWMTFERIYGPLRVSLVPREDDLSTAVCVADVDADCGAFRVERLIVEGDERTLLESGQATMPADGREFRVYHLFSSQPLQRDSAECRDQTAPQPSYAVVEVE